MKNLKKNLIKNYIKYYPFEYILIYSNRKYIQKFIKKLHFVEF